MTDTTARDDQAREKSGAAPGLPGTYDAWSKCIAEHLFRCENDGVPIVLYIDDEIVATVAEASQATTAVRSLARVVRARLRLHSDDVFGAIRDEALLWSAKGKVTAPPFMPVIAVATLAAARMASEGDVLSTNYYRRLRELLDLPGQGEPKGYGDTLPLLWTYLAEWLDDVQHGRFGRSTIAPGAWAHIGYALSQTVMKRADRERLGELFDAMDLEPGDTEVDGRELLTAYRSWAPHSPLSVAARRAAPKEECAPQLQAILETELRSWDGNKIDEYGNRVATVHLAIELSPIEMFLIASRPRGFPQSVAVTTAEGRTMTLQSTVDGWYDRLNISVGAALTTGTTLHSSGFTFRLAAADLIPLRQDTTVGAWVSAREVQPYVTHCVLVKDALLDKVREYLTRYAESDWQVVTSSRLPADWSLIRGIAIAEPPDTSVSDELAALVPSVKGRVALAGGLPMPSLLPGSHNWYLLGGEPDVWVPRWSSPGSVVPATVDGALVGSLVAGGRLRLAGRQLGPGDHEVTVGSSRRHFFTLAPPDRRPDGSDQLAHCLYRSADGYTVVPPLDPSAAPGDHQLRVTGVLVSGADGDMPPPPPHVVRLRTGASEYRLIGAKAGEALVPVAGHEPGWLRLPRAPLQANFFDVVAPFPVVWALWRWRSAGWTARLVNPLEPSVADRSAIGDEPWSLWSKSLAVDARIKEDAAPLWAQYRAAAGVGP